MTDHMQATVAAILASGKGILAADETGPTIESRFNAFDILPTYDNRRVYREVFFTTPGLSQHISAAIMVEETLRQQTADGVPMLEVLTRSGIVPGANVDKGTVQLPACPRAGLPQRTFRRHRTVGSAGEQVEAVC